MKAELCNICERPAVMLIGAGPRCQLHQYFEGPTLEELRKQRDEAEREIGRRRRGGV